MSVLFDPVEENWPSMDLVAEMLLEELRGTLASEIRAERVCVPIRAAVRRLPRVGGGGAAFNADRLLTRFATYPLHAARVRTRFDLHHVADHSYAQLVHVLPAERTGVFCHDLDTFRCLTQPEREPRPPWFRAMARVILRGMQRASVVFHSTLAVREQIERYGLLDPSRLVHAPYGVSREYTPDPAPDDQSESVLAPLGGRPYVLHVGSAIARKRIDVLFETFARVREGRPELRLVQQGGALTEAQRALLAERRIAPDLLQPSRQSRATIAGLYRRAAVVLVPSDAEGFGFPVVEALACGAIVVASDIPVLREVGGDAALYCPVGDVRAWARTVDAVLGGRAPVPGRAARLAWASRYTWQRHARTVLDAYRRLDAASSLW